MSEDNKKNQQGNQVQKEVKKERFFRVRFQEQADENAPKDVHLGCQGRIITVRRGDEVVLPERFLESARNAVIKTFKQEEIGKNIPVVIRTYPYDNLGEAKEEDYLKQITAGTRRSREEINRSQDKE